MHKSSRTLAMGSPANVDKMNYPVTISKLKLSSSVVVVFAIRLASLLAVAQLIEASLYQILQILSVTLFEKTPILCALQAIDRDANFAKKANQLILFDF